MKILKIAVSLASIVILSTSAFAAHSSVPQIPLYIAPAQDGFQISLQAAMQKKHVPVSLSMEAADAQFELISSPIEVKTQTTGSKFARCIFADCIGIEDRSAVSVQLVNVKTKQIVWAYTVHKQRGGAMNDQSMAEAVAKHLKEFMEKNPALTEEAKAE